MAALVIALLAAFALLAAPASASTLSRDGNVLVYTASPGETNEVGVFVEGGQWVIRDRVTIALAPGSGCTNQFGEEARCGSDVQGLRAALGDGNDRIGASPLPGLTLDGGDGNDTIEGNQASVEGSDTPVAATLIGGPGDDVLTGTGTLDGGDGNDQVKGEGTLRGGGGNDVIEGQGTLEGGDGDDQLKQTATTGVSATLLGGPGNDTLEGSGTLDGGPGDDRLEGTGTLLGGPGNDVMIAHGAGRVAGGPGNDIVKADGLEGQTLDCDGGGDDLVDRHLVSKIANCGPGASARIAPPRVRLRRFLSRGARIGVTCDTPCAVIWTLLPGDRRTQRGVHTGGGHLSRGAPRLRRVPQVDASFPVFSSGRQQILIRALGRATKRALGRMRSIKVRFDALILDRRGVAREIVKRFTIRR